MKKFIKIAVITVLILAVLCMLAYAWAMYRNCANLIVLQSDGGFEPFLEKLDNLEVPFRYDIKRGDCHIRSRDELMPIIAEIARGFDELHIEEVYREAWNTVYKLVAVSAVILAVLAVVLLRKIIKKRRKIK